MAFPRDFLSKVLEALEGKESTPKACRADALVKEASSQGPNDSGADFVRREFAVALSGAGDSSFVADAEFFSLSKGESFRVHAVIEFASVLVAHFACGCS